MQNLLGNRWYVRHQLANFELNHNQGSLENAEEEGRKALELEPTRASVIHTLAEISRVRAQKEIDGSRKDLYRQQTRERLHKIKKDYSGFSDRSHCKLRLDEMSDALKAIDPNDDKSLDLFAERLRLTRQAIDIAIDSHPTNPDILRLRADFFRILKDDEKAQLALERAWKQNPKGPSIGLQLFRVYRDNNSPQQAQKILEEILERHSQDPSVNLEMALHCIREVKNIDRAAYYLTRSYYSSDRNYVARYVHAQYLLHTGEGDRSAELFDEVNSLAPSDYEPRSGFEITKISNIIGRINGRVLKREESFAFLKLPTYPRDIYTNISNNDVDQWARLTRQTSVSFNVGFNRNGPVGIDVRVV